MGSIAVRWRRLRYRRASSAPYLSGDLFRDLCDVALDAGSPGRDRAFLAGYAGARSIFVKTDLLPRFLAEFAAGARACRVLVTGNSDLEIHDMPSGLPRHLECWFAQNAFVRNALIRPLPIGLENCALGMNGVPRHFHACSAAELAAKRQRVFVAPFSATTPERDGLLARLSGAPAVDAAPVRLAPRHFQARLRAYRFVVAPRGNGIDTHRFWEALYADAVPVTRRTAWSQAIREEGLPVVEVDAWDELLSWTDRDLARMSAALPARPSAMPWLWAPFWRVRIGAS